jgi:membrane-bound lytic murein transglycosylase B
MTTFLQLLALLPNILQAIIAVESVFGVGQGAAKKAMVMSTATASAEVGQVVSPKLVTAVASLIDSSVTTLKAAGVIATAPASPVAPVPASPVQTA